MPELYSEGRKEGRRVVHSFLSLPLFALGKIGGMLCWIKAAASVGYLGGGGPVLSLPLPRAAAVAGAGEEYIYMRDGYLVDPASSHMLVSKIKPCMCKYKLFCTVKLRMAH